MEALVSKCVSEIEEDTKEEVKKQQNHTLLDSATLKLTPESVTTMDRHVMCFGGNHLDK